jgi:hypothetical protein
MPDHGVPPSLRIALIASYTLKFSPFNDASQDENALALEKSGLPAVDGETRITHLIGSVNF